MNISEFLDSSATEHPFFVLLGRPVSHSLSPLIHNHALHFHKLSGNYYPVEVPEDQEDKIAKLFKNPLFTGANVTIPLKQRVRDFLDTESEMSTAIGAVNTVVKTAGKCTGFNTDVDGFLNPLKPFSDILKGSNALVFGTGGAARAAVFGLQKSGVEKIYLMSRNPENIDLQKWHKPESIELCDYSQAKSRITDSVLIVNCSPLGMEPDTESSPVADELIPLLKEKICYDIVYKPLHTTFLNQGKQAGATIIDGLEMFVGQAAVSFKLWTGYPFPEQDVKAILMKRLSE